VRARLILDLLARPRRYRYGPGRSQRVDLHLPRRGGPHPVAILVHGGNWHARYGKILMRPLAVDLARQGWAVWNIEYRRLGRGGGWPHTFLDVAAAVDLLDESEASIDLDRTVVVGHSAGGQLALWAAGRYKLAPGAPGAGPRVRPQAAVSQAGVNDLTAAYRGLPGGGAVGRLMGGGPDELAARYDVADPIRDVPLDVPVLLVHGRDDDTVSVRRSRDYARTARERGASVDLVELAGPAGSHRAHLDPSGQAWSVVTDWLGRLRTAWSPGPGDRARPTDTAS
jgi:acetyl esterase/lipase